MILSVNAEVSDNEFLGSTGMPQEKIEQMDPNIKDFIVNNLKQNMKTNHLNYVEVNDKTMIKPMRADLDTGVVLDAVAFRDGSVIRIYPTYEFVINKHPKGEDSFAIELGDAFQPYEYGGTLWVLDERLSTVWTVAHGLAPTNISISGAIYSGDQLGDLIYPMKLKGATYCYANIGSGTNKNIAMTYIYNPNKFAYSISVGGSFGISIDIPNTVYNTTAIKTLSY